MSPDAKFYLFIGILIFILICGIYITYKNPKKFNPAYTTKLYSDRATYLLGLYNIKSGEKCLIYEYGDGFIYINFFNNEKIKIPIEQIIDIQIISSRQVQQPEELWVDKLLLLDLFDMPKEKPKVVSQSCLRIDYKDKNKQEYHVFLLPNNLTTTYKRLKNTLENSCQN